MSDFEKNIGSHIDNIVGLLNLDQPMPALGADYAWFVGATGFDDNGEWKDFSEDFINEGRWENGYEDKYNSEVNSIQVGDKIALKSAYTKKKGLPFNNNGKTVGVMAIKAIGTVTENTGDGRNLKVDWKKNEPIREWYGKAVLRLTLHKINASDGLTKKLLLKFTFENAEQDYSLCEEQYASDLDEEKVDEKIVSNDIRDDYSLKELGDLLSKMYNETSNKTTAVHMFGVKYGAAIKNCSSSAAAIAIQAGLSDNYGVEINKGVRIFESIQNNEFGITFYDNQDSVEDTLETEELPKRTPRKKSSIYTLNSIIYGAPGTGKTYSTPEYSQAILKNISLKEFRTKNTDRQKVMEKYNELISLGFITFTTFHQSYGYEDFIQGLRPDTKSNNMSFRTIDGVFKRIADRAIRDQENNYVIIIDEINRANISKVFGELITLIEEDKRWGEINQTSVTLPSGQRFAVPNNLYILGTMNSADKSISLIDAALRRRFDFIEQRPDASLVVDVAMRKILVNLNIALAEQLDSTDLLIGHSYFLNKSISDLPKVFNSSIIPLLYEYFYDNKKKIKTVLNSAIPTDDFEIVDDKIGRIYIERKNT